MDKKIHPAGGSLDNRKHAPVTPVLSKSNQVACMCLATTSGRVACSVTLPRYLPGTLSSPPRKRHGPVACQAVCPGEPTWTVSCTCMIAVVQSQTKSGQPQCKSTRTKAFTCGTTCGPSACLRIICLPQDEHHHCENEWATEDCARGVLYLCLMSSTVASAPSWSVSNALRFFHL